jgi:hypothetical protein
LLALWIGAKIDAMGVPGRRAAIRRVGSALAAIVVLTSLVSAQIWVGGRGGRGMRPKWATPADFDGSFVYCRGYYDSWYREAGGSGWNTDYPGSDNNFSVRLAELTRIHVKVDANRQPNYAVVSLTDPLLYRCPILFMEDVGTAEFSEDEARELRDYLQKGGFLWVDDFWGSYAWDNWTKQIGRVLPPGRYPIVDLPLSHAVLRTLYDIREVPQVPNISFWRANGGETSERYGDSADVHFRGIQDEHDRLMVLMTHNTDIADTWEREGDNHDYFEKFSPRGYAFGVNVIVYAMTH